MSAYITCFAETVIEYSLNIRPGDLFIIRSTALAAPLVKAVYAAALKRGAHPVVRIALEGLEETFFELAGDEQMAFESPLDLAETEQATVRLYIDAPYNTRALSSVPPERLASRSRALSRLSQIFMDRSAGGQLRWCSTLYPTQALAQEAGMSLNEYEDFVFKAMILDQPDPAGAWRAFSADQQQKVDRLDRAQQIRIVAEGTDLTLSVEGRRWINSDGKRNFPSGEVFTGPVEDSANGVIHFSFPAVRGGREVEDVSLTFSEGKVVKAEAGRGADYLHEMLSLDEGACFLGEVAIGNNAAIQRYTKNVLFDEKIGGTCHLALGASYPETGGRNRSALHWDMVCDLRQNGAIYADGELIYEKGQWIV